MTSRKLVACVAGLAATVMTLLPASPAAAISGGTPVTVATDTTRAIGFLSAFSRLHRAEANCTATLIAPTWVLTSTAVRIADPLDRPAQREGEIFLDRTWTVRTNGSVYLSGAADSSGDFWVDDSIDVTVTNTN